MIAASRSPSVDVDADEKDENDDEKWRAIKAEGDHQNVPTLRWHIDGRFVVFRVEDRRKYHSHEKDEKTARKQTNLEGRPRRLLFPCLVSNLAKGISKCS